MPIFVRRIFLWLQSRGGDLTRLALHHFMTRPGVTSHLMGVTSRQQVRQNLEMSQEPISAEEQALLQEVLDRYERDIHM